jgi:hypothetical protein
MQRKNSYGSHPEYTIVVVKSATDFSYDTGPLLTTNWHQSSPYNSVCNSHSGGSAPYLIAATGLALNTIIKMK